MIELHLHLDGSLNPKNMVWMAEMSGVKLSFTEENELKKQMMVEPDCKNLGDYLEKFDLPLQVLQTKECLEYALSVMENQKFLRERKGWSQQKLADELFISQQSVYKYENGLAYPSLETLRLMSKLFNVSIDYIVGNYSTAPTILSEAEKKLLKNFNLLNPKQQKIINALLESMLS